MDTSSTGPLDSIAATLSSFFDSFSLPEPLQTAVRSYMGMSGMGQQWRMFSNPPQVDRYIRVRYYISTGSGAAAQPSWMATELVMPAHREDRIRLFQSFRDSYEDKAFEVAMDSFYRRRRAELIRPDTTADTLPDDLAPVARYFSRRFANNYLSSSERVIRTEVWIGTAPIPRARSNDAQRTLAIRIAALRGYYEGPIESRLRLFPYPPYHAADDEADIRWLLEYFEQG